MISNQILQNTIEGVKSISRMEFAIMDTDGKEVASTVDMSAQGERVVEFGEHPNFASLHPDKLVGVVHVALAIEAGEVSTALFVLRLFKPEGDNLVEQFVAILLSELFEIHK